MTSRYSCSLPATDVVTPTRSLGLMGGSEAHFADAETVRAATGYAIGGVSPFALPEGLPVLVDDSLGRFETVYPAAGTPASMVKLRRTDLLDLAGGRVACVSL